VELLTGQQRLWLHWEDLINYCELNEKQPIPGNILNIQETQTDLSSIMTAGLFRPHTAAHALNLMLNFQECGY